jgi:hypothetical protein
MKRKVIFIHILTVYQVYPAIITLGLIITTKKLGSLKGGFFLWQDLQEFLRAPPSPHSEPWTAEVTTSSNRSLLSYNFLILHLLFKSLILVLVIIAAHSFQVTLDFLFWNRSSFFLLRNSSTISQSSGTESKFHTLQEQYRNLLHSLGTAPQFHTLKEQNRNLTLFRNSTAISHSLGTAPQSHTL